MPLTFTNLWKASRPLTLTGCLMLAALVLTLPGLILDPRLISGAPAWLKPAKFAISTAIYSLTLAWVYTWIPGRHRLKSAVAWITAIVMVVEVGLIDIQAARGVGSHFNNTTAFDTAVFAVMGIAILAAWIASLFLAVALFRTYIDPPAMAWALRLGMAITVFGAGVGGAMVSPTHAQLEEARRLHERLKITGAHTVGAPDGGPGLPGVGWSREHGDLRVPHFLGLHAIQILPFFAWLFGLRRRPGVMIATGGAYAVLVLALLAQAMAGRPLLGGF